MNTENEVLELLKRKYNKFGVGGDFTLYQRFANYVAVNRVIREHLWILGAVMLIVGVAIGYFCR